EGRALGVFQPLGLPALLSVRDGVATIPDSIPALGGSLAGLCKAHDANRPQPLVAQLAGDAIAPAVHPRTRAGFLDEQIQPVAVGIAAWCGQLLDLQRRKPVRFLA